MANIVLCQVSWLENSLLYLQISYGFFPLSTLHFLSCIRKTIVRKLLTVLNSITFPFCPCLILEANLMLHLGRLDKWNCSKSCV